MRTRDQAFGFHSFRWLCLLASLACFLTSACSRAEEDFEAVLKNYQTFFAKENYLITFTQTGANSELKTDKNYLSVYKITPLSKVTSRLIFSGSIEGYIAHINLEELKISYNICGDVELSSDAKKRLLAKVNENELPRFFMHGVSRAGFSFPLGFSTKEKLLESIEDPECYQECLNRDCNFWKKEDISKSYKDEQAVFYFHYNDSCDAWNLLPSTVKKYEHYGFFEPHFKNMGEIDAVLGLKKIPNKIINQIDPRLERYNQAWREMLDYTPKRVGCRDYYPI